MNVMGCVGLVCCALGKSLLILAKMLLHFRKRLTRMSYIRDYITQSSFKISVREN